VSRKGFQFQRDVEGRRKEKVRGVHDQSIQSPIMVKKGKKWKDSFLTPGLKIRNQMRKGESKKKKMF